MRHAWLLGPLLLCALPARGDQQALSEAEVGVLTPVDSVPAPAMLDQVFAPAPAATRLIQIANDTTADLGIQIRAIRALAAYCPPGVCTDQSPVHQALVAIIQATAQATAPAASLRLIAAVEALGETRSGLQADFELLWPLLDVRGATGECAPRRDVRSTAARAIGALCYTAALDAMRAYADDPCLQVAAQAERAVATLDACSR